MVRLRTVWLPLPRLNTVVSQINFDRIIQAFQDLRYIGEMRQRWEEIKRLQISTLTIKSI